MKQAFERLRARYPWLDRVIRAQQRYNISQGDTYAAGITYLTIFALFPILMMAFAVVGFVLASRPKLLAEIDSWVKASVSGELAPQLLSLMNAAIDSRTSVGLIGLAVALWAGLSWMNHLRGALSHMWGQPHNKAPFLHTKASDLLALLSIFGASVVTLGLTALPSALGLNAPLRAGSLLASLLASWLLFSWVIARLPRQPVSLRCATRAGLLAAVGFEIFKQVGSTYLEKVVHGPAGVVFGPVLGLMVFAYVTNRLVLVATAWAAEGVSPSVPADSASGPPESD